MSSREHLFSSKVNEAHKRRIVRSLWRVDSNGTEPRGASDRNSPKELNVNTSPPLSHTHTPFWRQCNGQSLRNSFFFLYIFFILLNYKVMLSHIHVTSINELITLSLWVKQFAYFRVSWHQTVLSCRWGGTMIGMSTLFACC